MTEKPPTTTLPPPLKWAGGKRWLVPALKILWSGCESSRLVEPFCGGLAATLGLNPAQALLNDINPHLINFYTWLQKGLQVTIPLENDSTVYYRHRAWFNQLIRDGQADSTESAQLFYYLNRTGYNGLCRFNQSGEFNVPFGKYKTINYTKDFSPYRQYLAEWHFQSGSFDTLDLKSNDFIYADPPYDVEFVSYAKEGFRWDDQVRLVDWLVRHDGPVVLSNQATDRIVTLYQEAGFTTIDLMSPRRINSTGDRTPAREVLALRGVDISKELIESIKQAVSNAVQRSFRL